MGGAVAGATGATVRPGVRRGLGLAEASLEWPNDVVVRGAKLAGILVETRGFDPQRPGYVLGMGLNVAQLTFPAELEGERKVTSLRLEQVEASIPEAERAFADRLTARGYGEDQPKCKQSTKACWSRNRRSEFVILKRD